MESLVIVSKFSEIGIEKANKICEEQKISSVDREINSFEKTVGIPDIRTIQKKLYLKPIKGKSKTIIIDAPSGITTEAQNSLLKILEEPPANTFIILIVENKNLLLPTVISRCKMIEIKNENFQNQDLGNFQQIIGSLQSLGIGDRLVLAQNASKTKEEALLFLEKSIYTARDNLIKNPSEKNNLEVLKSLQEGYIVLKTTNTAPRLTLENLFLNL